MCIVYPARVHTLFTRIYNIYIIYTRIYIIRAISAPYKRMCPAWKLYNKQSHTGVRETGASQHHGFPTKGPTETPRTSHQYCIDGGRRWCSHYIEAPLYHIHNIEPVGRLVHKISVKQKKICVTKPQPLLRLDRFPVQ